jgi:GNAT superfamily N-acetyltransferase
MASIVARSAEYKDVEALRGLYRSEANCQIIGDSRLARGLADPYIVLVDGRLAGYGAVTNKHDVGRLFEFYTLPGSRSLALPMLRELLTVSGANAMEAQTNIPWMLMLLFDCATDIEQENILFYDAFTTSLGCPNAIFRRAAPDDAIFDHMDEPMGDYVLQAGDEIVATGGFLCHYNPPYGDVYMEVAAHARGKGYGSYIVQELKRVCYEAGKRPAARCNVDNVASRSALQRAGFLPCGRLLAGKIGIKDEGMKE